MSSVGGTSTLGRAIHVKVHPRPRSIADSSQVLNVLRQFGEIDYFKHGKYDPAAPAANTFVALYKTKDSASLAIQNESLEFEYPPAASNGLKDRTQPSDRPEHRPATIAIRTSRLNNLAYIARQPYFAGYPVSSVNSLNMDMRNKMPQGLDAMARLDYTREEPHLRQRNKWRDFVRDHQNRLGPGGYMGLWKEAQLERAKAQAGAQPSEMNSLTDDMVQPETAEEELSTQGQEETPAREKT